MNLIRLYLNAAIFIFSIGMIIPSTVHADALQDGRAAIGAGEYEKALRLLIPLAKQGNTVAQNAIGVLYLNGWGVNRDYAKALKWFRESAQQGEARGQFNLGGLYDAGQGVDRNYELAAKWYRKSAEQGYPPGQSLLASMYARGNGVSQDYTEAMKWYRKAADQGDAIAQTRVGFMFVEGQGVPKNYKEAEKWFRKAASQGHPLGYYWLGRLYFEGWGVKKNYNEAVRWSQQAADHETQEAQYILGYIYANGGDKVEKDDVRAIMWLRRAAVQGYEDARKLLKGRYSINPEAGPRLTTVSQVMKAPQDELARSYLLVSYHVKFIEPAQRGAFRATFITRIDGKEETINESNALIYLAGYKDRLRIYSRAIQQQGFQKIANIYDTKVTRGCKKLGFEKGKTKIFQDDFKFKVANGAFSEEIKHRGIIVQDRIAVEHAMNPEIILTGQARNGKITLRHSETNCVVELIGK